MKGKAIKILIYMCLLSTFTIQSAFAGTAFWKPAVETSYDLSFPGTILVYKDELSQGGLNLQNNTTTTDKNSADIVFDTRPDIAARGVKDLGAVNFETVTEIANTGFGTALKAEPGHVYIVLTHDNNFAKILVKSVIGQKVFLKFSLLDRVEDNAQNGTNQGTDTNNNSQSPNTANSGTPNNTSNQSATDNNSQTVNNNTTNQIVNNNITNQIVNNSVNNQITDNSVNNQITDNSVNNQITDNSVNNQITDNSTNSNFVDNSVNTQVTNTSVSIVLNLNKLSATVNGTKKSMDVAPFVENGRTLVPLRFVGESLGADVDWNPADESVTLSLGNTEIVLWLNKRVANLNGKQVWLDVPAKTYRNRTVVPIRFVSENLGLDVGYNDKTGEINVKNSGKGSLANSATQPSQTKTNNQQKPVNTKNPGAGNNADLADFFHLFRLVVPGAVNEVPVGLNAVVFKATPGALAGGIAIYADGTYIWNSTWDGKIIKGKWKRSGDSGYPITILNGEEGKDWKLGRSGPHVWGGGDIVIWDGSIWKNGTKVK